MAFIFIYRSYFSISYLIINLVFNRFEKKRFQTYRLDGFQLVLQYDSMESWLWITFFKWQLFLHLPFMVKEPESAYYLFYRKCLWAITFCVSFAFSVMKQSGFWITPVRVLSDFDRTLWILTSFKMPLNRNPLFSYWYQCCLASKY